MSRRLDDFLKMARGFGFILAVILLLEIPAWATLRENERAGTYEYGSAHTLKGIEWLMLANGRGGKSMSGRGSVDGGLKTYQNLTPEEKAVLRRKYREWQSLPPEEKRALRHRMEQWRTLPDDERRLYRHRYDQWQQLSPKERQGLRKKLDNWKNLSPDEKEYIKRRFKE